MLNIENIIPLVICVNMSDYLKITLEKNRKFFKEYYVLTCPEDIETINLCKEYDATVINYDCFFNKNNCSFNKSGGIEFAQRILHRNYKNHWILLIDVDIVLIDSTIDKINQTKLNKEFLYGIDRYDVWNSEELLNEVKTRLYKHKFAGFFQLYFNKNIYYYQFSKDASECDITFMKKFKKKQILDTYIFHLGKAGSHWKGRGISWV